MFLKGIGNNCLFQASLYTIKPTHQYGYVPLIQGDVTSHKSFISQPKFYTAKRLNQGIRILNSPIHLLQGMS